MFLVAAMAFATSGVFASNQPVRSFISKEITGEPQKKSSCTIRYTKDGPNGPVQVQITVSCECTQQEACQQAALQIAN
ncbi:MAG: hypothetical protein OHK0045_17550 [Raineya sp.]